jgi:hypothetical protein
MQRRKRELGRLAANSLRCQAIAVAGLTMSSAERQSPQTRESNTHNRRSAGVSFGRFLAKRLRTPIWCWRAMCSNSSTARERNIEPSVEKRADNRISIRITAIFSNSTGFR